jgi:geranylgeranyl reductase family protein
MGSRLKGVMVVGAGPVGLRTAIKLARNGWNTSVLEEHPEVGQPVQCAGLISRSGAEALKLDLDDCLVNKIKGARIFAPDGTEFKVEKKDPVAYVIDRGAFDKSLFQTAKKNKVEVKTNTSLIDVRGETVFYKNQGRGEIEKARLVIGADGVNSKVRELMKLDLPLKEKVVQTVQVTAKGSFNKNLVEMHFGQDFAPGFFGWVIPESAEKARIGLGARLGENMTECFKKFTEAKGLTVRSNKRIGGLIPIGEPLRPLVKENMVLVGDAAFQTKATTGGGIVTGIAAADLLVEAVNDHFKGKRGLNHYETKLARLNKDLRMHWKVRKFLDGLNDKSMNKLLSKMNQLKVDEFLEKEGDMDRVSAFLPKLMRKPKFMLFFPQMVKYLLS